EVELRRRELTVANWPAIDHAVGDRHLTKDVAVALQTSRLEHRDVISGRRVQRLTRDRIDHRQQIEQFVSEELRILAAGALFDHAGERRESGRGVAKDLLRRGVTQKLADRR